MNDRKKQLKEQYKARAVTGGVYRLRNTQTGKYYLRSTDDMNATRNWFKFAVQLDNCTMPPIQEDWKRYGAETFVLEEVDLIDKGEDQTPREFQQDVKTLFEMWSEKLADEDQY